MIEFGKSLRLAREAKGYTVAQLAEMTRLAPSLVSDLENEDFRQIAAPIYGRGFVRLYCEAVGLETKAFVDEFMEIFNGNREPHIKERPLPGTAPADAPVRSEPVVDETPIPAPPPLQDLFQAPPSEPTPESAAAPDPEIAVPAAPVTSDAPEQSTSDTPDDRPLLSRYSTNFRTIRTVSPTIWRMGALALVAAVLLAAVFLGLRALRRVTMPADRRDTGAPNAAETVPETPAATSAAPEAKAPRTPQSVAPLYID